MLIFNHINVIEILEKFNVLITGILHIGANDCQEYSYYKNNMKISEDNTIWVDAIQHMVDNNKKKGIQNIFCQAISDVDYQEICVKKEYNVITKKIDTFLNEKSLGAKKYNFWNIHIQGQELMALKGALESIKYADAIYLKVYEKQMYKGCGIVEEVDCFLYSHGFKRVWTDMLIHNCGEALYVKVQENIPVTPVILRNGKRVFTDIIFYDNGIPPIEHMKKYGYKGPSYLEITNNKAVLINKKCNKGKTALQYACENNCTDIVKILLANNANTKINSDNGETLVGIAKKLGNLELMRILLAK